MDDASKHVAQSTSDSDRDAPDANRDVLEWGLGVPFTEGNTVDVLRNGVEIFPAMLEAITSAQHQIDLLTYIYWHGDIADQFTQALADRARAGVRVRVMLDAFGSKKMPDSLVRMMTDAGIEVQWFRPLARFKIWQNDHRTHRKVMVCDNRVAFTGGVGIAEEWTGDARNPNEWRETHFRLRGPAVKGLHAAFLGNWAEMGRPVDQPAIEESLTHVNGSESVQVITSSASVKWSTVAMMMRLLVGCARERLRITTPYFVPDQRMLKLLCQASKRGVDVEVIIPGPHIDERVCQLAGEAVLDPLLQAGVTILRYQPTVIHTKIMTIDNHLACLGSANMNQRSMCKDDEVCCIVISEALAKTLDEQFEEDAARSEPVDLEDWRKRSLAKKALEKFIGLFSSEL